jgi:hypothetical protein
MSKGETLSYWRDNAPEDAKMAGLFVKFDKWLFVGIYEKEKLKSIVSRDYAQYPDDCIKLVFLP